MNIRIATWVLFLLPSLFSFGQTVERVNQKIERFQKRFPQEKLFVQTDKPYYALGETIWFKAWLTEARRLMPSTLSNTFYVDLVNPDGKVVATRNLKAEAGSAHADIPILPQWPQGRYQIRAYTQYMRNFDQSLLFQKELLIWNTELPYATPAPRQDFTLQFAPEGGDIVVGLPCRIGIKAVDQSGNGIDVSGKIVNDLGGVMTNFKTQRFGLGMFELQPRPDRKYFAELEYQGKTLRKELPAVQPQGYTLKVFRPAPGFVQVVARTTAPAGLKGVFMVGQMRGEVFWSQACQAETDEQWKMPIDSLPEGVAQFTLFSASGQPLCERLIFIENPLVTHSATLKMISGNPGLPHQKINLGFELKDAKNNPVKGSFAATVTDQAAVQWVPYGLDIRSYLLLQSDIRGRVENPAYFFDKANGDRYQLLDILLMTQGWRRFPWKEVLRDTLPDLTYASEKQGFLLTGKISKANQANQPAAADLMLSINGPKPVIMPYSVEADGRFAYAIDLADTTSILLQASKPKSNQKGAKSKKKNEPTVEDYGFSIWMDKPDALPLKEAEHNTVDMAAPNIQTFVNHSRQMIKADTGKLLVAPNPLATATIKTRRKEAPLPNGVPSLPYGTPQHRIIMDSLPYLPNTSSTFDLITTQVSGVRRNGNSLNIRGAASFVADDKPLYLIDGSEVGEAQAASVRLGEIAFIDVLKNADEAAIYGSRGANGVVSIYTRRDGSIGKTSNDVEKEVGTQGKGSLSLKHPGYYHARQFYVPTYDTPSSKPDLRTTLHWQPILNFNELGQSTFGFFTADKATGFDVIVQGISEKGYPIVLKLSVPGDIK